MHIRRVYGTWAVYGSVTYIIYIIYIYIYIYIYIIIYALIKSTAPQ